MGLISLEVLLPEIFCPDDSVPIRAWGAPPTSTVSLVGFKKKRGEPIVFEGEAAIGVKLCERTWRYQRAGGDKDLFATRWRLEVSVDKDAEVPLSSGAAIVIAQKPFANGWVQHARLNGYSKKSGRIAGQIPADLGNDIDQVEWLERNITTDPWELSERYVAGISRPHGYRADDPRNQSGDFIFGACPDHKEIFEELFDSREIRELLKMTKKNTISFTFEAKSAHLYEEVIDNRFSLMEVSIQQALAGPESFDDWKGRLVADLVSHRYRDHLNNANREADRLAKANANFAAQFKRETNHEDAQ
jgi:hypothetical protein